MTDQTTAETPWPVRTVARKIDEWINRLGDVWIEGQLTQVNLRRGAATAFLVLRDPAADVSLSLSCKASLLHAREVPPREGDRVIVHGRVRFWAGRGTLSVRVDEIRAVGIGDLLARIERLRRELAAEGLFDPARKRTPPLLPRRIGLITGRASAAERDVLTNAHARWPQARFAIHNVAVQGPSAVPQIVHALSTLDRTADVDVIVVARGGGSVEDLLPFSDETLCRAVAAASTPVLSAIGHEPDSPLLDQVADRRCSTPTDAGKTVVPDVAEHVAALATYRGRARRALQGWVDRERRGLDGIRSRPSLADPHAMITGRAAEVATLRAEGRRAVATTLTGAHSQLAGLRSRLATLGPAATMARGYAVVQRVDAEGTPVVLRTAAEATVGTHLRVRLPDGALHAVVTEPEQP